MDTNFPGCKDVVKETSSYIGTFSYIDKNIDSFSSYKWWETMAQENVYTLPISRLYSSYARKTHWHTYKATVRKLLISSNIMPA